MSVEPEAMASPHLPPEILQMVFRILGFPGRGYFHDGFFDLMRCMRVCKTWAACLPGNDPELSRMLFLKDDVASKGEDECSDEDCNEQSSDEEYPPEARPVVVISVIAPGHIYIDQEGTLPKLGFTLDFRFSHTERFVVGTEFHPMVEELEDFMHNIHPNFSRTADSPLVATNILPRRDLGHTFWFTIVEELQQNACLPDDYVYNDGSWDDMMLCEPAIEQLDVQFHWDRHQPRAAWTVDGFGEGITVGHLASTIRVFLAGVGERVKSCNRDLGVRCIECNHLNNP